MVGMTHLVPGHIKHSLFSGGSWDGMVSLGYSIEFTQDNHKRHCKDGYLGGGDVAIAWGYKIDHRMHSSSI